MKVAFNGLGRIGRATFKILATNPELDVVAINDVSPPDHLAYLLNHDTVYGRYANRVCSSKRLVDDGGPVVPRVRGIRPGAAAMGRPRSRSGVRNARDNSISGKTSPSTWMPARNESSYRRRPRTTIFPRSFLASMSMMKKTAPSSRAAVARPTASPRL